MPTASTRETYGKLLVKLGRENPDIVVLGGDLNISTFAHLFGQEFPERFFDFGPAEQNIMSVAAGFASSGKLPFVNTFAVFATSRPYDQIRVGIAQPHLNVKIAATHAGIITGEDGMSAHGIEDLALMSALPGFTVITPADATEVEAAVRAMVSLAGPCYLRLYRSPTPVVHNGECRFILGKAEAMRQGNAASIIACGSMVSTALAAADKLASEGVNCLVLNMHTLKPLDEDAIVRAALETGAIVTAEEHYIYGGLGSLVSQVVGRECPVPMEMVALRGYAESGKPEPLLEKYGLTAADVEKAVRRVLKRKG